MDLAQLVKARRTIQNFAPGHVPDEWVREALELSLWVPNHKFTFPWVYVDVQDEPRARMIDLALELKAAKGPLSDAVKKSMRDNFSAPSHFISLGLKKSGSAATDKENFATLACSVEVISLLLWEKGVGVKWATSGFTTHAKTYEILGLSPTEISLEGVLLIGKAAHTPPAKERPPLSTVLR